MVSPKIQRRECARDHASALVIGGVVGEKDVGRFEGRKVGRRGGGVRDGVWRIGDGAEGRSRLRLWSVKEERAIGLWGELYEQRLYPQGADIAFVLRGLAPRGAVGL